MKNTNKKDGTLIVMIGGFILIMMMLMTSCDAEPLCKFEYTKSGVTYTEYYDCDEPIVINESLNKK